MITRHLAVTGLAVVAIVDVDEVLRECATPRPASAYAPRANLRLPAAAATETEGGARVTWKRGVHRRTADA